MSNTSKNILRLFEASKKNKDDNTDTKASISRKSANPGFGGPNNPVNFGGAGGGSAAPAGGAGPAGGSAAPAPPAGGAGGAAPPAGGAGGAGPPAGSAGGRPKSSKTRRALANALLAGLGGAALIHTFGPKNDSDSSFSRDSDEVKELRKKSKEYEREYENEKKRLRLQKQIQDTEEKMRKLHIDPNEKYNALKDSRVYAGAAALGLGAKYLYDKYRDKKKRMSEKDKKD